MKDLNWWIPLIGLLAFIPGERYDDAQTRITHPIPSVLEPSRIAGLLTAHSGEILPLAQTDVTLDITATVCHADIRQTFVNDTDQVIEAVYTFPLPEDATITQMSLRYADQHIRSVVREKIVAQNTYREARQSGKRAGLLENPDTQLFRLSVANLRPGERVDVAFAYVQPLPLTKSRVDVLFPTTFGPRYTPTDTPQVTQPVHGDQGHPTMDASWLKLRAEVRGLPVRMIDSTSHAIEVYEVDQDHFQVQVLEDLIRPDRDFVLSLDLWPEDTPQVSFIQSATEVGAHGLLTLFPPLAEDIAPSTVPRELVFLIDTSGSMDGGAIERAKEGLKACLNYLDPRDRFQIVRFSSDTSALAPDFLTATDTNLNRADAWIDQLRAEGGTEMQAALRTIFDLPHQPGYLRQAVFLTDGDVGNPQSLLNLARNQQHRSTRMPVFAIGVGGAPNEFLIRKLAAQTGGAAFFLRNQLDIDTMLTNLVDTLDSPVMTNLRISFQDLDGNPYDVDHHPRVIPDLYQDKPVQIAYRHPAQLQGSIRISGRVDGIPLAYSFDIDPTQSQLAPGLERVYGKRLVDDLMAQWHAAPTHATAITLKQDIIQNAVAYQLITPFTARVAVAETPVVDPQTPKATYQVRNLAVNDLGVYPATATDDPLRLILGGLALIAALVCLGWLRR